MLLAPTAPSCWQPGVSERTWTCCTTGRAATSWNRPYLPMFTDILTRLEMTQAARWSPKPYPIVDGFDHVEVASIDALPASDPPGWIEARARPRVDATTTDEFLEETVKDVRRAANP